jgi:hypothetical protein
MKIFLVKYTIVNPDWEFEDELLIPGQSRKEAETTLQELTSGSAGIITLTAKKERILVPMKGSKIKVTSVTQAKE